jgi:hypothetical protein
MYALLWRAIPGPGWFKFLVCLVLAFGAVAICFTEFFPWLSEYMPFNDTTVGA